VQKVATKTEEGINVIVEKTKKILKKDQMNNENISFDIYNSHNNNYNYEEMSDRTSDSKNMSEIQNNISWEGQNISNLSYEKSQNFVFMNNDKKDEADENPYPKFEDDLDKTK
jgi:hypothetical protein